MTLLVFIILLSSHSWLDTRSKLGQWDSVSLESRLGFMAPGHSPLGTWYKINTCGSYRSVHLPPKAQKRKKISLWKEKYSRCSQRNRDKSPRWERERETEREEKREKHTDTENAPAHWFLMTCQLLIPSTCWAPKFHKISLNLYNKSPSLTNDFKPITRDAEAKASLRLHQVSQLTKI